jgi:hypothetical protein
MSGFVPGIENDLFISYSHLEDPKWVQAFEKSLTEALSGQLGLGVSVWRDEKRLRAGQNWQTEIECGVKEAAAFVAILSPVYENSEWCTRERQLFIQIFESIKSFENSNRFFKAVKTPWENDQHKQFLATIQTQDFFGREEESADAVEFLPTSDAFRKAMGRLAQAIAPALRRLRRKCERVFIASPAADCLDVWKQLREELRDLDYDVQPEGWRDEAFGDELLRKEMEGARLSVFLLGEAYNPVVEQQIRLAADLDQRLMIWLAPGAEAAAQSKQTRLIDLLRNGKRPDHPEIALPQGWALLPNGTTLRQLSDEVETFLKSRTTPPPPLPSTEGVSSVYIVHDATTAEDNRIASELRQQIVQQEGMKVHLSQADFSSASELRLRHEGLLQTCDGVLLCRNAAPKEWLMQVAPEVILAERLLQRQPFKSRAFLVDDPSPWKGVPNLQAIPYGPQFRLGDLEPFLAPLRT